jgi:hypothetical protein
MVAKCFEVIKYFQPFVWILENPVNRLQDMTFMRAYDDYKQTTAYCMYAWGFHKETAQSGFSKLQDGIVVSGTPPTKAQQMPFELLKFLFKHVYALY